MPVQQQNFYLESNEDGTVTFQLSPPVAIGSWDMVYEQQKFQGVGSPQLTLYSISGFYGQSGISVIDSGAGIIRLQFYASQVSGQDKGAYFYNIRRTNSGFATDLLQGYRIM